MLNLKLRKEFEGRRLKGTAIEFSNRDGSGALQIAAKEFLEITYPTHDILKGLEAIGPDQGRPIAVIGERGSGKSHLLAALSHAAIEPEAARQWLSDWAQRLGTPAIEAIKLRSKMNVIAASMHEQRYKHIWDLLFEKHPRGEYYSGVWKGLGEKKTEVPPRSLIEEMLAEQPIILLLDEFQTWYDGLTNSEKIPDRQWAFNFIQILSEMATSRPDLLVLVVSVRNGSSDAYQQIHRNNPVQIDFKAGGSADRVRQDRRRMVLHRLFENRMNVADGGIRDLSAPYADEYLRLMDVQPSEREKTKAIISESWPFAPALFQLLEDQVLIATDAQETRDLIKILANLFKSRGEASPVLTAADFRLDEDDAGIGALLDSIANHHHRELRERAQRNLIAVTEAVPGHLRDIPHLPDIMASLWLRSIAVGNMAGADRAALQSDATRGRPIDDNGFNAELSLIIDNSFNIHEDGMRLVFREEENPQAKLMSTARNDKLFLDGSDLKRLAKEARYVLSGRDDVARDFKVVVLPQGWMSAPWVGLEEQDQPNNWDERLPILVLPEEPDRLSERLGRFIKEHLEKRRNAPRFLIPSSPRSLYADRDLVILARAVLKSEEWARQGPEYRNLQAKYEKDLRERLKSRWDRVAVLDRWLFSDTSRTAFHIEALNKAGSDIPEKIKAICQSDLWVQEDFEDLILSAAANSESMGKMVRELQEPRPSGNPCIPWLGETEMKERILKLCAKGRIAINAGGANLLQAEPGEADDEAWRRMRSKLGYSGRQLDEVFILMPSAGGTTGGRPGADGVQPQGGPIGSSDQPPAQGGDLWGGTNPMPDGGAYPPSGAGGVRDHQYIRREKARSSALNHISQLELWNIGPATPVQDVTLKLSNANGAQLKSILKNLPDGLVFDLELEQEDDEKA